MYFLVANLLHQLPLEHNSSSTVTFSVLPRAGSLATGKELEWGNSTYIHEIIYKEKNKILSDQEGENYDKEWLVWIGARILKWMVSERKDDNVENGLAKKRQKAEMSVRRCCNEERRDEWRMSEMNGR